MTRQDRLGDRGLQLPLHSPFQRSCPLDRVITSIGEPAGGPVTQAQLQLTVGQLRAQTVHPERDQGFRSSIAETHDLIFCLF